MIPSTAVRPVIVAGVAVMNACTYVPRSPDSSHTTCVATSPTPDLCAVIRRGIARQPVPLEATGQRCFLILRGDRLRPALLVLRSTRIDHGHLVPFALVSFRSRRRRRARADGGASLRGERHNARLRR